LAKVYHDLMVIEYTGAVLLII